MNIHSEISIRPALVAGLVALCLAATPLAAAGDFVRDGRWRLSLGAAHASVAGLCGDFAHAGTERVVMGDCGNSSPGLRASAAYQFHPNIAAEAGFVYANKISYDYFTPHHRAAVRAEAVWDSLHAALAWSFRPTDRVSVFAKTGASLWSYDERNRSAPPRGGAGADGRLVAMDTVEGGSGVLGLGGELRISDRMDARLEWERYLVGKDLVHRDRNESSSAPRLTRELRDVDVISLSVSAVF